MLYLSFLIQPRKDTSHQSSSMAVFSTLNAGQMPRPESSGSSTTTFKSNSAWSDSSRTTNSTQAPTWVPPSYMNDEAYNYWREIVESMGYSPDNLLGVQSTMPQPPSSTHTKLDGRPTLTSLGWSPRSPFLEIYKFVVERGGRDPYFQLLDGYAITEQTPARVFLDPPRYDLTLHSREEVTDHCEETQKKVHSHANIQGGSSQADNMRLPNSPISSAMIKISIRL